jgi:hypothetical protein
VEIATHYSAAPGITAADFPPAFLIVGAISAGSVFIFMRLAPNAGHQLTGRQSGPSEPAAPNDQRLG